MASDTHVGWQESLGEHATNPPTPRAVGETLFMLGKEYTVSSCENRIKAQFEKWVRRNAKLSIREAEAEGDSVEADKLRSTYQGDFAAGYYKWDGKNVLKALMSIHGARYLLLLLLQRCDPAVTAEQVEAMFEEDAKGCGQAIAWALGNSRTAAKDASATLPKLQPTMDG